MFSLCTKIDFRNMWKVHKLVNIQSSTEPSDGQTTAQANTEEVIKHL